MSTWKLFTDDENNFRWGKSDQQIQKEELCYEAAQLHVGAGRLPSMADLLLIGCSKLVESANVNLENAPMFRTGSGKSVALKQSSMAKARSVLGDIADVSSTTGQLDGRVNGYDSLKPQNGMGSQRSTVSMKPRLPNASKASVNMSNSMFKTGSGKAVNISTLGVARAKSLLGLEGNEDQDLLRGSRSSQSQAISSKLPAWECPYQFDTKEPTSTSFCNSTKAMDSYVADSSSLKSEPNDLPDFMKATPNSPVKFQTAGGRSISVSSNALQRARSLLGNQELDSFLTESSTIGQEFSVIADGKLKCPSNAKVDFTSPFLSTVAEKFDSTPKNFTSPFRSTSYRKQPLSHFEKIKPGNNLISKFDAEAANNTRNWPPNGATYQSISFKNGSYSKEVNLENGMPKIDSSKRMSNGALLDISNTINTIPIDNKQYSGEKRRFGRNNSVSSFKKPRSSFVAPLNKNNYAAVDALSRLAPKESCSKERVSMRYPHQTPRPCLKEYILQPPAIQAKVDHLPKHVRLMNPISAGTYMFQDHTSSSIGPDDLLQMMLHSGASIQNLSKEWVLNHLKWIAWKLASYERCYPTKFLRKMLTVSNVLEELKYRYEREVNHGHRSSIKKVLDGDAPPSLMMVLCISSVDENHASTCGPQSVLSEGDVNVRAAKIELTDGWYSVKAMLDEFLSQKLASGKLFVGQKLRIWGAKLSGWVGPITPFEAAESTSLLLHVNGTYRCHWAERLGFCKTAGFPLAFRCIKARGGTVPSTLVGVTRLYPVLYRERLSTGSFIVRSERVETKVLQLFNQRRSVVAEGIMSAAQMEELDSDNNHDCEEGAKIMKLLEMSAEPEVIMAGMSSKQLNAFASYKAKLEANMQANMQRSIEKALEEAALTERDVTPFMRVRVVGLTNNSYPLVNLPQNGLITIWNPTEKQKIELSEGQAYAVRGLIPSSSDSCALYLIARGSTTNWRPLSPSNIQSFRPFFIPRTSSAISNLGDIPLCSEFDIAALVVYVGDVHKQGRHQKQWVFVTDGSSPEYFSKESSDALLAISFCLPYTECDSFAPVSPNLTGSVVGFSNLIKRSKDLTNGIWSADATENSDYFLNYDQAGRRHFKDAASSVSKWANTSNSIIERLKEHIKSIVRNSI